MIKAENVTKNFADVRSLDAVSVALPDGCILGLIGSNGSGKSTLLRVMSGIMAADAGCVLYDGSTIWENAVAKEKMIYLSDEPYFLPHASLNDMKCMYRDLYRTFREDRYTELVKLFGLNPHRKIQTFSRGMQKQAAVLLGLSACPQYLFCDETFDGLDPVMRQLVKRLLAEEVAERKISVVIASHNLRELEDICDRVALLHRGGLLFQRELDDMKLTLQKIQAVFDGEFAEEELLRLPVLNLEKRGSMYTIVARGAREELETAIRAMHPQFYEFIPLTLEEIFISEMEGKGYDYKALLA